MTSRPRSSLRIVFILGLLAMLMPLSIDMYLPALPVISTQFGVPAGSAQMTLSTYILGFALGQLLYGPMADSLGRKPVILGETVRKTLFGDESGIGQSIRLGRVPFTVVGILGSKGQGGFGQDQDDIVVVPLETARRRLSTSQGMPPSAVRI